MEAIKQNDEALRRRLGRAEGRETVMEVVKQDGRALLHASAELQGDRDRDGVAGR